MATVFTAAQGDKMNGLWKNETVGGQRETEEHDADKDGIVKNVENLVVESEFRLVSSRRRTGSV